MSSIPDELQYTKEHEWVGGLDDGRTVTVGVTEFAAQALGDVVFVQLPEVGTRVEAGDSVGEIESTKSVNDLFSPADGEVVEINPVVVDDPSLVNSDPYGDGWMFRMRVDNDPQDLLSAEEYTALTQSES
ncbi:glycine cleavage system protein GcvH [Sinosporangium siamense]|uniref:Glycine cleavage system H protein n=1 Tax=Sinosporangium siamense TaxID=1367973 RepID=A0A919VAQ0_9ACTN|nr:glycine cleavage system protein GcvH [Sinosporangium siamense]GII91339.1 glycine cleavage system H protein [Sinosporangium siamense]